MAGDQQAATIGQGCLAPGQTKATFGTGAFVLTNKGDELPRSDNRMLGTVLLQEQGQRTYAIEGSVFVAGSLVKWLRDALGIIGSAPETEALARSIPHSGGGGIVPAPFGAWRAALERQRPRGDYRPQFLHWPGGDRAGRAGGDGASGGRSGHCLCGR